MANVIHRISSVSHPIVKRLVRLRVNSNFRHKQKSAFVEGRKLIADLIRNTQQLQTRRSSASVWLPPCFSSIVSSPTSLLPLCVVKWDPKESKVDDENTKKLRETYDEEAEDDLVLPPSTRVFEASHAILQKLSQVEQVSNQAMFAEFPMPLVSVCKGATSKSPEPQEGPEEAAAAKQDAQSKSPIQPDTFLPSTLERSRLIVVVDGIQDPGNLGTLLRSALALGWEGCYILQGSVDPFNDKCIRAGQGAQFFLPIAFGDWDALTSWLLPSQTPSSSTRPTTATVPIAGAEVANASPASVSTQVRNVCLIADTQGPTVEQVLSKFKQSKINPLDPLSLDLVRQRVLLFLSSEGHGPSAEALKFLSAHPERVARVSIPMSFGIESLNVATSGSILMHNLHTHFTNEHSSLRRLVRSSASSSSSAPPSASAAAPATRSSISSNQKVRRSSPAPASAKHSKSRPPSKRTREHQ